MIHHTHKVKSCDSLQLVRDGNDSMIAEFFVDEGLDFDVCFGVDAVWERC
jgi:hypothetical protein